MQSESDRFTQNSRSAAGTQQQQQQYTTQEVPKPAPLSHTFYQSQFGTTAAPAQAARFSQQARRQVADPRFHQKTEHFNYNPAAYLPPQQMMYAPPPSPTEEKNDSFIPAPDASHQTVEASAHQPDNYFAPADQLGAGTNNFLASSDQFGVGSVTVDPYQPAQFIDQSMIQDHSQYRKDLPAVPSTVVESQWRPMRESMQDAGGRHRSWATLPPPEDEVRQVVGATFDGGPPLVGQVEAGHDVEPNATTPGWNYKAPPRPPRVCCCFSRWSHCISVFGALIAVLIALVILLIPFALPQFTVSNPYLAQGSAGVQIIPIPLSLKVNILEDYTVESPSYFTLAIHQLQAKLELKDLSGNLIPGFSGTSYVDNLRFPARSTVNFTAIPLNITYTPPGGLVGIATDPAVLVLQGCNAVPPRNLQTKVTISLDIAAISWTSWKPTFSFDLSQRCPAGLQIPSFS